MSKKINRRDFLNGASLSIAGALLTPKTLLADAISNTLEPLGSNYYPPILTGMRGSHKGAYETAHKMAWMGQKPQDFLDTEEEYDLVVVGGGVSGLAAAYFYQQNRGKDQRILVLDNHDDFGGHAKRNEFHSQGKMLLGFGGSVNLESPSKDYSRAAQSLLNELGVDFDKLDQTMDQEYPFASLRPASGLFIENENGQNRTVIGQWMQAYHGRGNYSELVNQLPIDQTDKVKLINLIAGQEDLLEDLSLSEKETYLNSTSYYHFLTQKVGLSDTSISLFDGLLRLNNGVGGDGLSVMEAFLNGAPGLSAIGTVGELMNDYGFDPDQPYHANFFPDGNASVTRMLVRRMIPEVAPGNSMNDIASARFDYSMLDRPQNSVRIRLNSTAVDVKHKGQDEVSIGYVTNNVNYRVKAKHCILACYNGIIPHLCPELPEEQKQNLKYGVKVPLVWANVVLQKGTAFHDSGAEFYECPNSFFEIVTKAPPTKMDDYQAPQGPEDPMVVFMGHSAAPLKQGEQTARDQFRLGRHKLYTTSLADFEQEVRDQLNQMFGAYGFDSGRDIEAITINRWSHGYAYNYYALDDSHFEEDQKPHLLGRKQHHRISIANSDSEARGYLDAGIDAAWRAVKEQLFNV